MLQSSVVLDEYAKEAHLLVDGVIEKASKTLVVLSDLQESDESHHVCLTIEDLTIESGKQKINEFIQSWQRAESWLYHISFLCKDVLENSIRYRYKVEWSIPTRRKPIPRATASIYFTIEASTVKPKNFPCKVYYVVESCKLVHRPGHSVFREKWLKDIITCKIQLMETVTF